MAVNESNHSGTGPLRRLFLGANVTVAVLLVVFLVVAANFIAHRFNQHRDLSGGLTGYRLSDRTKTVLAKAGPMTVTTVYTSSDPEKNYKDYLPKLRDFCDELERASKQVKVEHISDPGDQAALRDRVSSTFGSATGAHKESTQQALAAWEKLRGVLETQQQTLERLGTGQSWLRNFSSLAARMSELARLSKNLEDNAKEVRDLIEGEALPKYSDASSKITAFNDDLKRQLDDYKKWAGDMDKLAKELADPNSAFLKLTRERNEEITKMSAQLRQIIGDPKDQSIPDDPTPVLKNYGTIAKTLGDLLYEESSRAAEFLKQQPALRHHGKWTIRGSLAGLPVQIPIESLLAQTAEDLSNAAQVLRSGLRADTPKDKLQNLVRQVRATTEEWTRNLAGWTEASLVPFEEAAKLDEASRKFLADVSAGEPFKDVLKETEEIATRIKALPQQKMDEIGERLKQDNIVVVETEKEVRILPFDEVWPLADRHASRYDSMEDTEGRQHRREFNGDSAICNAMMDMQSDKKVATVIFVSYENQPPPQMRQFQRPSEGPIPASQLSVLRERLERANFAVKEWNLSPAEAGPQDQTAGPKPIPEPPAPETDTDPIYVFLPPAEPPMMNPFMMQQMPQKQFGEAELKKVREVLNKPNAKAKAIFLAAAMPRMGMGPASNYGYNDLLQEEWGIKVEQQHRVVKAKPSAKKPGLFSFLPIEFNHMRLNYFTDQPIGKPLRSRRMLMLNVCPVLKVKDVPDVQVTTVLEVPEQTARDMWAEADLTPIITAIRERTQDSMFAPSEKAMQPPFPVILAAQNQKTGANILVVGSGMSFLDGYMDMPVARLDKQGEGMFTDPPPAENVELFANSLYWLGNRPELIAAGPADVPFVGPITDQTEDNLWYVTMGWAVAALVVGAGVMFVRRK